MKITDKQIKTIIPAGGMVILDKEYTTPTDQDIEAFLLSGEVSSFVNSFIYKKDSSDCDNAAWDFVSLISGRGWPVGLAILDGHAIVMIINNKSDIVWIEPQTGKITRLSAKLRFTVMP